MNSNTSWTILESLKFAIHRGQFIFFFICNLYLNRMLVLISQQYHYQFTNHRGSRCYVNFSSRFIANCQLSNKISNVYRIGIVRFNLSIDNINLEIISWMKHKLTHHGLYDFWEDISVMPMLGINCFSNMI